MQELATASEAIRSMSLVYNPNWTTVYSNFLGDALTAEWAAAKTNGTSATATVATNQLILTVGTDNDGYAGQGFGLFWKADSGIFMESVQKYGTAITTAKMEIGLTDAIDDAGAVNDKATPTATATDFAVLCFDTDDNAEMDLISQNTSGVATNATDVYAAFAGDTKFATIFRAQNDLVQASIGSAVENATAIATNGAIQGGTLVTPWWYAQNRLVTNANWTMDIEYAFVTGPTP